MVECHYDSWLHTVLLCKPVEMAVHQLEHSTSTATYMMPIGETGNQALRCNPLPADMTQHHLHTLVPLL